MEITLSQLDILRLSPEAKLPTRAHEHDAGLDLYALEGVVIGPQNGTTVRTGIALAIPPGYVGMIADRSSMAKRGLKTAGGIVDSGYRGEVQVVLWNLSTEILEIGAGERIAQLLVIPVLTPAVKEVPVLSETARGAKGFGSTGK